MAILVTGGAGYIGSITTGQLVTRGEKVVVLDNLRRGHRQALRSDLPFYQGDVGDEKLIALVVKEHEIESCLHFAALAYVGESVERPHEYFENNVQQGITLFTALAQAGVRRLVFSSSCAIYGEPAQFPIVENAPQVPVNPYGWSKLFLERVLASYDNAFDLKFVALRYFNAAGATETLGEHHDPETHLIPNVLRAASGRLSELAVFGSSFPTPDGTAIRDYVHVSDLADAHLLALDYLRQNHRSEFLNLATGRGHSVLEVIECVRQLTGKQVRVNFQPPRPGDPARLVADSSKAQRILNWTARRSDLSTIIRTAWDWHLRNPEGYAAER